MANGKVGAPKGNQNARKGFAMRDALRRSICKKAIAFKKGYKSETGEEYETELTNYELGCELIADEALSGEALPVFREVADRLDGKPAQSLEISGDEDNPLQLVTTIERRIIGGKNSSD